MGMGLPSPGLTQHHLKGLRTLTSSHSRSECPNGLCCGRVGGWICVTSPSWSRSIKCGPWTREPEERPPVSGVSSPSHQEDEGAMAVKAFARAGVFPFPFNFPRLLLATGSLLSPVISNSCPPTCHKLKEGWGGAELFSSSRAFPEAPAPATFSRTLLGTSTEARITALPSSRDVFPGALPVLEFRRSSARPAELQCGTSPVPESPAGCLVRITARAALWEWRFLPTHSADPLRVSATPPRYGRRHV
ncbi:hypothetical protein NDU88_004768 [Pleurodeles waltl]|uniref:Uncharacterized protein n=1 Tax=Pleurodeles waltl TaxID=8319 RepID=A0AAV7UK15_PLEWA|nr:hypothetical protein NDU88_004768 [Pleurodeles waltl]